MFYGSFLLLSFGAGGCMPVVTMAVVANWFFKKVGIALGLMACGFGASGVLVPLIIRFIDLYGWRNAFVIFGVGMWAVGIPLSLVIRDEPEPYGYVPDGRVSEDPAPERGIQTKGGDIGFGEAIRKKGFIYLNMTEAIRVMVLAAVVTHVMPYLESIGIPRSFAGLVAAGIPLFSIMGRFGFGWLGDIYDKRYVMAWTFLLMAMGTLAFRFAHMRWVTFFFLLLFSSGFGGGMVLRGAILREYFGRESFGKLLGILMGSASLGGVIGPTLAGWTFDSTGSYYLIWLVFCGLIILAILLILRITVDPGQ
jgi:MFS family permease